MTAVWLLPIVPTIVAAASGGLIAEVLQNNFDSLITIILSYVLWGIGMPMSLMVLVLYLYRLSIYKLPEREIIVSVFLPLGLLGQGSFG
jgi:tellurite resistance protein TehA-like permease